MSKTFEILLVEDNEADCRLTQMALKSLEIPHHLSVVGDGCEALEFLKKEGGYANAPEPHLVILDTTLPKKSGEEVLRELKELSHLRHIPVVVLTGSEDPEYAKRLYGLDVRCYITKPISADRHFEIIQIVVRYWCEICARITL